MLRPYQVEALEASVREFGDGITLQLLVQPTGCGKTILAAQLPDYHETLLRGRQMMCLVHRDVLVDQTADKLHKANPQLAIGIERGRDRAAEIMDDLIVASVPTLGRENSPRLGRFTPEFLGILWLDEAHHGLAKSYITILKHFGLYKQEPENLRRDALFIGTTATPRRSDNVGLEEIFEKIVHQYPLLKGIEDGYLAEPHAWQVHSQAELDGVSTRQGDFAVGELENAVNTGPRNELVIQKYRDLGEKLPAIAFTVDVQHTYDLTDTAKQYDIKAEGVDGKTPPKKRKPIYEAFRQGDLDLICNCAVLTEGADFPMATVGLMSRPTKSGLTYQQMVGRIFRPYPAPEEVLNHKGYIKEHARIIDFVDNTERHELITAPTLFGLRHDFDVDGQSARSTAEDFEELEQKHPELDLRSCVSMKEVEAVVRKINLLGPPKLPEVIRQYSRYLWRERSPDIYHLSMPGRETFILEVNTLGQAEFYHSANGIRRRMAVLPSLIQGLTYADSQVPSEAIGALLANAGWRKKEPSKKQTDFLYKLDKTWANACKGPDAFYEFCVRHYKDGNTAYSRGGISEMIDALVASKPPRPQWAGRRQ